MFVEYLGNEQIPDDEETIYTFRLTGVDRGTGIHFKGDVYQLVKGMDYTEYRKQGEQLPITKSGNLNLYRALYRHLTVFSLG